MCVSERLPYVYVYQNVSLDLALPIYLNRVLVKMGVGGMSNGSLRHLLLKVNEDYRAVRENKVGGIKTLISKSLRKVHQLF